MQWRTKLKIDVSPKFIGHRNLILSIGSCFAQNIKNCLHIDKFNTAQNPFGPIYNPLSICNTIGSAIELDQLNKDLIVKRNGLLMHYNYHSELQASKVNVLTQRHTTFNHQLHNHLRQADWLIITLGTAMIYTHVSSGHVVTNCHKQPDHLFERRMLGPHEIEQVLGATITKLQNFNSKINIVLTVSPVRHTRDGLVQNSLNKAQLRLSCEQIKRQFKNIDYFPSYEIMMDDLRDYRFYEPDLIHPNGSAIEYIYDLFGARYFDQGTHQILSSIRKIHRGLTHRPINVRSNEHQKFILHLIEQMLQIQSQHNINYNKEMEHLQGMLN